MSTGSDVSNPFISSSLMNQDLERLQFARNLRKNPADYAKYVTTRTDQLTDEILSNKRTAFQKAQIDLGRYMNMDHNAAFYKTRAADVNRLSQTIDANNSRVEQGLRRDKDISKRQFEINEWYNYNKLETLFFLQVFFISALSMAIIIFLQKNATITNALAALLTGLLFLIVLGIALYRYYYTRSVRDNRLWHRRYFGSATPPPKPAACSKDGTIELDINTIIPKAFTQCADEGTKRFSQWQNNLEKEMEDYMETGQVPGAASSSSICPMAMAANA
jgi:hypothetical protein